MRLIIITDNEADEVFFEAIGADPEIFYDCRPPKPPRTFLKDTGIIHTSTSIGGNPL